MNRQETLDLLQDTAAWNQYREANPDFEPDLNGENLSNRDLSGANLEKANLGRTTLNGAILNNANLKDATFDHAEMKGIQLQKVQAQHASLKNADLKDNAGTRSNLSGGDFQNGSFEDANLHKVILTDANLHHCNLQNATFWNADCSRAKIIHANVEGAIWEEADLTAASIQPKLNWQTQWFRAAMFLDETGIGGTVFTTNCREAWTTLKRTYRGIKMVLCLMAFAFFLLPYVIDTCVTIATSRMEALALERAVRAMNQATATLESTNDPQVKKWVKETTASLSEIGTITVATLGDKDKLSKLGTVVQSARDLASSNEPVAKAIGQVAERLSTEIENSGYRQFGQRPLWQVVIGANHGWLVVLTSVFFVAYNIVRYWLTMQVNGLADIARDTKVSPSIDQYRKLWTTHSVVCWVWYATLASACYTWWTVAKTPLLLPI